MFRKSASAFLRSLLVRTKVVCILLTLLHLGIKNIRLGPSLPGVLSPNILNFLMENYGIAPITTPEEDIKTLLNHNK
ncbi:MAG: hypothetical protein V8S58_04865 [Lachnospiraceae bacterium]